MLIFATFICLLLIIFFQSLLTDFQNKSLQDSYNSTAPNLTLTSLISESILQSWISDPPKTTALRAEPPTPGKVKKSQITTGSPNGNLAIASQEVEYVDWDGEEKSRPTPPDVQGDAPSVPSTPSMEDFVESLFDPPEKEVEGDWSLVLGTFEHYDDENWDEFLIKTEVPQLVRMFLKDSSETVTITRAYKGNDKKDSKLGKKHLKNPKMVSSSSDFEVSIETSTWLITHVSKFRMGNTFVEHDLDGTDSKNTFFFSSPRLLIHNKIKDKWRTAIVRHFDKEGLNMTFVDRDRMVMARRFFKRAT